MTSREADRPFRGPALLLLAAFFVSGIAGLVHEIAWTRILRLVMGNTTFSITTVLTVFMAGLALGSFLAGRLIERRDDPIRVFALLEGAIGITCLLLPFAIDALEPVYRAMHRATGGSFVALTGVRFLFCGLVLLPTATMMGSTLPVLVRFFAGASGAIGLSSGRLYAINTLGAVVGACGTGFVLIPWLGVTKTIWLASALNFAACGGGLALHARLGKVAVEPDSNVATDGPSGATLTLVLVGYALSGFSALVYEVAWTRVLSAMIGSSVYAFSMMLTAFILGLGAGSLVFARFVDRLRDPLRTLALLQAGIAASALLVVPLLGRLPIWITGMISRSSDSFWGLQAAEFGLMVAIMVVPTSLMGATFPLVSRIYAGRSRRAARSVGAAYSANTVGSILGSFAAGFLLVPAIGTQSTIYVAVLVNGVVAGVFALQSREWSATVRRCFAGAIPVVLLVGVAAFPTWNPSTMSFGPFYVARRQPPEIAQSKEKIEQAIRVDTVLLYEEGIDTTITVRRDPLGEVSLWVNGKPDASSTNDLPTQAMLAHVPLLLHPDPKDSLVIGLASGITLGSAAMHPLEKLDCAEISSAVVRACELFAEYNHDVLDDPRVEILVADGRNHLALSGRRYDVIVSEPSNPWIAGVADLFTREFFELCREALRDDGVVCIWLERYNVDEASFKSVVRTFHQVFPSMTVWNPMDADYLLVGAKGELALDLGRFEAGVLPLAVGEDLVRIGILDAVGFLSHLLMGADAATRFGGDARIHTDDNALLEFAAPRILARNVGEGALFELIEGFRDPDLWFLRAADADALAAVRAAATAAIEAKGHALRGKNLATWGRDAEALAALGAAAARNPDDPILRAQVTAGIQLARAEVQEGRVEPGLNRYLAYLEVDPARPQAQLEVGQIFQRTGRINRAIEHYRAALAARADWVPALESLAFVLAAHPNPERRDAAEALAVARKARDGAQHANALVLRTLAVAQAANGLFDDARATLAEALSSARGGEFSGLVPTLEEMSREFEAGRAWTIRRGG